MWQRNCPVCKTPISKERGPDTWKCPKCGWSCGGAQRAKK